jgi:RNA polymerase sigma-70 factor (ECF subfamily)
MRTFMRRATDAATATADARVSTSPRVGGSKEQAGTARTEAAADRLLVRRFNDGDQSAFTEIVQRHRDRIQNLAIRFLRDPGDAEEVAQDTFVRAFRGLAKFRGESSLATWLHHIATNLARNRY